MGARTFLDRLDAAVVFCTAKLWSELLAAFASAGQPAAGARYFAPDLLGADESAKRRPGPKPTEHLPDDVQ